MNTKTIPLNIILTVPNCRETCWRIPNTNVLIASAPNPLTTINRTPTAAINVPTMAKTNCFAIFGLITLFLSFLQSKLSHGQHQWTIKRVDKLFYLKEPLHFFRLTKGMGEKFFPPSSTYSILLNPSFKYEEYVQEYPFWPHTLRKIYLAANLYVGSHFSENLKNEWSSYAYHFPNLLKQEGKLAANLYNR